MTTGTSDIFIFDQALLEERAYWIQRLAGKLGRSELPPDYLAADRYTQDMESLEVAVPTHVYTQLIALTNASAFLLYTALLTALMICLQRYTQQATCVVGSPRRRTEGGPEPYSNAVVIIEDIEPTHSFRHHLLKVRQTLLDAYAHQRYPVRRLIQDLEIDDSVHGGPPLFSLAVALTTLHDELPDLHHDIAITFTHEVNQLSACVRFNHRRYRHESIDLFIKHYFHLLAAALEDRERPIAELPLGVERERTQLLAEWNATAAECPINVGLHQLFEAQVLHTPNAPAVVCGDARLTYDMLNRHANRLARRLRRLGVGPEVAVGIGLERSVEAIVGLLAVLKAGGAYVPLDLDHPQDRLEQIVRDSAMAVIIGHQLMRDRLPSTPIPVVWIDADLPLLDDEADTNLESTATMDNAAYIIYTSGSTGTPKGVTVTHRNVTNYAWFICHQLAPDLGSSLEQLQFATGSTISTDLGNTAIFPSLMTGGCLHILPYELVTDAEQFAAYVARHPIDVLKIVPSHLQALLGTSQSAALLPRRYLILGGEPFSHALLQRLRECAPTCRIINHYGPTETTIGSLTYTVTSSVEEQARITVPIGRPIVNTCCYVLDGTGTPVLVGVPGELYIGGSGVARGYHRQPAHTAERFIPNPFAGDKSLRLYRTGDLVRYLPDGNIEYLGRLDHQLKIRGFRVELTEIEATLAQHPAVEACVVEASEDSGGYQQLVAYVVPHAGHNLAATDLRDFLRRALPAYMIPSSYRLINSLPLTLTGKVDRKRLHAASGHALSVAVSYVAPRSRLEHMLVEIWQSALGLEQVGISDNFFDLGGHSLLMVQVHSKLKEILERDVSMIDLFRFPTIETLSAHLHDERDEHTALTDISTTAERQRTALWRQQQMRRERFKPHDK